MGAIHPTINTLVYVRDYTIARLLCQRPGLSMQGNARKRERFSALTEEEKMSLLASLERLHRSWSAFRPGAHGAE